MKGILKMKKFLALFLVVAMFACFAACGTSKECVECGTEERNGNKSYDGKYYCYSCYNLIPSIERHCCLHCGTETENLASGRYRCESCDKELDSIVKGALAN